MQAIKLADARFPGLFDGSRSTFGVLASQWYPAPAVHTILDELTRGLSADEMQNLARSAAQGVMSSTLRGAHRIVLSTLVSPERYLKHVDTFWRLHYDTGTPVVTASAPTEHRAVYVDWTSHHPFACQLNMASARPLYEAMGCNQVQYKVIGCVALGKPRCETEISWSA